MVHRGEGAKGRVESAARVLLTAPTAGDGAFPWGGVAFSAVCIVRTLSSGRSQRGQLWDGEGERCLWQTVARPWMWFRKGGRASKKTDRTSSCYQS